MSGRRGCTFDDIHTLEADNIGGGGELFSSPKGFLNWIYMLPASDIWGKIVELRGIFEVLPPWISKVCKKRRGQTPSPPSVEVGTVCCVNWTYGIFTVIARNKMRC